MIRVGVDRPPSAVQYQRTKTVPLRRTQHAGISDLTIRRGREVVVFTTLMLSYVSSYMISVIFVDLVLNLQILPSETITKPSSLLLNDFEGISLILCVVLGLLSIRRHDRERLGTLAALPFITEAAMIGSGMSAALWISSPTGSYALFGAIAWLVFLPMCLICRHLVQALLIRLDLWQYAVVAAVSGAQSFASIRQMVKAKECPFYVSRVIRADEILAFGDTPARTQRSLRSIMMPDHAWRMLLALDPEHPQTSAITQAISRSGVSFMIVTPAERELPTRPAATLAFAGEDAAISVFCDSLERPIARHVKHGLDVVTAGLAIAFLAPVFVLISVLIIQDGGPILYRHERVGRGGQRFSCLKFRTMAPNSTEVLDRYLATHPSAAAEWYAAHKLSDDPRITRIGALLRRTSLDELPQLFNVVRGDMSLVGPRPVIEAELERYADNVAYYYKVRPGLTGLWQISGRSTTTYARRVQLDVWYVRNWSLGQDMSILLRTIPAVLTQKGAV